MNPKPTNFTDPANAERLTDVYVYKMIKDGGAANGRSPLMVAWNAALKDDEIRDVSAYVLKFKPAPAKDAAEDRAAVKNLGATGPKRPSVPSDVQTSSTCSSPLRSLMRGSSPAASRSLGRRPLAVALQQAPLVLFRGPAGPVALTDRSGMERAVVAGGRA